MTRIFAILISMVLAAGSSFAQSKPLGVFDVEQRRAVLAQPASANIRAACLAIPRDPAWNALKPIPGLKATQGYGTDGAANDYAWAVMVLTGRSLAGDLSSEGALRDLLIAWAKANAFSQTEVESDAYYALKRILLPSVVGYSVIQRGLDDEQRRVIAGWLDPLVRKVDYLFDGSVDHNNHRYLTDSVLMAWGAVSEDQTLYEKCLTRYRAILHEARADGSLPLETRRGSRALWYMRQSLASMTVMAEIAATRGDDLYAMSEDGGSFDRVISYTLNGITEPRIVMAYASENYIPGDESDFRKQDLGFLSKRSHGRHYMAWAEAVIARDRPGLATRRLKTLFTRGLRNDRPLIDEFAGGNATCIWGRG
ncbi:alginate lyase family protein [Microvirga solisilvae]|uniref:alginate lyase family protein n=1 Tax=Microvirga solisilvae TaxID=2919498 RepID=UPI001FAF3E0C|nr:alginate lyase family protein [Microvirga solisilvae]